MYDPNEMKFIYEALFAIAESYTSISYMDVEDGVMYPIRLDDFSRRYEDALKEKPLATDILRRYANEVVYKDDAEGVIRFGDRDYVLDRLKNENTILHTYRTIHNDKIVYYRLKIVQMENFKKVIYGFENIDSNYRHELDLDVQREIHTMVLDGLSREYLSVWYLDGKSRKVKLVQNNGTDSQNGEPVRIGSMMVDYHFSMQKYFDGFVDPEDFDRLMHETSYDNLVMKTGDNDLYPVNYIRINPDGTRSHFQACYAKIVDSTGIANFVFGFRNMDSAI